MKFMYLRTFTIENSSIIYASVPSDKTNSKSLHTFDLCDCAFLPMTRYVLYQNIFFFKNVQCSICLYTDEKREPYNI